MSDSPIDLVLSRLAGVRASGAAHIALCPAHPDRNPSLSVAQGADGRVLLNCHRGCSFPDIVASLGLSMQDLFVGPAAQRNSSTVRAPTAKRAVATPNISALHDAAPTPCPADVERIWSRAVTRAALSPLLPADVPLFDYLRGRGLDGAVDLELVGFLDDREPLPPSLVLWPRRACRLVAPLFSQRGELTTLQARRLTDRKPKTLFPAGSHPKGCVFANANGLAVLNGSAARVDRVVVGEGLTDFWALSLCFDGPVLSAPGTSFVVPAIGGWCRGCELVLALDNDDAGRSVLDDAARSAYAHGARCVAWIEWPGGAKDACDALAAVGREGLHSTLNLCTERAAS